MCSLFVRRLVSKLVPLLRDAYRNNNSWQNDIVPFCVRFIIHVLQVMKICRISL